METLQSLLETPEVLAAIAGIAAVGWAFVKKVEAVRRWKLVRALECVEAGVAATYEEYVRALKTARADGKLTDSERAEARRRAVDRAKDYAAREGIDLLKVYAREYLPVLIEKIVSRNKAASKLPFDVLSGPELAF